MFPSCHWFRLPSSDLLPSSNRLPGLMNTCVDDWYSGGCWFSSFLLFSQQTCHHLCSAYYLSAAAMLMKMVWLELGSLGFPGLLRKAGWGWCLIASAHKQLGNDCNYFNCNFVLGSTAQETARDHQGRGKRCPCPLFPRLSASLRERVAGRFINYSSLKA